MLKVIDPTGNKHELTGRLEALVQAIVINAGDIARPQNAQIVFDCAGGRVDASIKHRLETTRPDN
jgi:hypothetical protein